MLSNPSTDESFSVAYSEEASEELSLSKGDFVLVWLSTTPSGVSGLDAEGYVIRFSVTDPDDRVILEPVGIAGRVWLWPLSFPAQQDGVHTMHFDNSMGLSIEKTVSLSYKITQSVFGVPVENLLLYISIAAGFLVLMVLATIFLRRA